MSGSLPPGPYDFETTAPLTGHLGRGHVYICDVTGRKIASLWGGADEKLALKDLIVGARGLVEALEAELASADRQRRREGSDAQHAYDGGYRDALSLATEIARRNLSMPVDPPETP